MIRNIGKVRITKFATKIQTRCLLRTFSRHLTSNINISSNLSSTNIQFTKRLDTTSMASTSTSIITDSPRTSLSLTTEKRTSRLAVSLEEATTRTRNKGSATISQMTPLVMDIVDITLRRSPTNLGRKRTSTRGG